MIQNCCNKSNLNAESLADFLKVISEENRLRIICFLQKNGEQCVCEIWKFLDLPQNLISHHLKVLRDFGLLNARKEGLNVHYSINHDELNNYKELFDRIFNNSKEKNGS